MPRLNVNLPDREMKILQEYCSENNRSQTDVIREFIRTLEKKPRQSE
ncbi:ribbon-helix-helix protein, CopG family [Baaleninema sp.]